MCLSVFFFQTLTKTIWTKTEHYQFHEEFFSFIVLVLSSWLWHTDNWLWHYPKSFTILCHSPIHTHSGTTTVLVAQGQCDMRTGRTRAETINPAISEPRLKSSSSEFMDLLSPRLTQTFMRCSVTRWFLTFYCLWHRVEVCLSCSGLMASAHNWCCDRSQAVVRIQPVICHSD